MAVRELLAETGFRIGVVVGLAVLVLTALGIGIARRAGRDPSNPPQTAVNTDNRAREPAPPVAVAGVAAVVATLMAMVAADVPVPGAVRLFVGLGLLVLAPVLVTMMVRTSRMASRGAVLGAVPGAALVAASVAATGETNWRPWFVFGATVLGGALVADFDRAYHRAGLGPVLLAVAVLGMYATLPDTEQVLAMVGAVLPLALLGTPWALACFGPGAYAVVGLVAWVAAVGGQGRPGSVVAAVACLGVMLVEPVVRRVVGGRLRTPTGPRSAAALWVVVLQVPVALGIARIAGLRTSAWAAGSLAVIILALAAVPLVMVLRRRGSSPTSATPDEGASAPGPGEPRLPE